MLFKFPMELLLQIFSHLPLPSRVCLALSCKDLYDLFGWVLKAEELRFPGLRTMGNHCPRLTGGMSAAGSIICG